MLSFGKGKDADTVTVNVRVSRKVLNDSSELRKITSMVAAEVRALYGDGVKTSVTFQCHIGAANRKPEWTVPAPSAAEQEEAAEARPVVAPPTGIGGSFGNVLSVV